MNLQIRPAPVRKSVTVNADAARAFEVFAGRIGTWWPHSHTIGSSPQKNIVLEPRAGGRWFEIGEDGSECNWGKVLAWEPPARLLLAWQIDGNWKYDPDLLTEVEVRFVSEGERLTRVEFEHRGLENYGDQAEAVRKSISSPGGWPGILEGYAAAVEAA